ncbi:DUF4255 domain-containing protein [Parapedobacter lycopersici]|uniref:DUF4255 domain-containing protein n=1 Tax=Parapedobacter lycopersici TaxID=1864939 RepID=UPI00214DBF74|nr:DUF4255 domain-containing protein [Parapedobacter lycopersici]
MIYQSLSFLTEQVNAYLQTLEENADLPEKFVVLKNVAQLTEQESMALDNVFITLVNISEESTMKNIPNYKQEGGSTIYRNAPVYLNMYVLFSSCVTKSYEKSLSYLSQIVAFFQGKNTFTNQNSPTLNEDLNNFKFTLDLFSPTFEQANYLWSTLGGKQFPHVLYRMRLVEVFRDNRTESRGIIKEIELNNSIS